MVLNRRKRRLWIQKNKLLLKNKTNPVDTKRDGFSSFIKDAVLLAAFALLWYPIFMIIYHNLLSNLFHYEWIEIILSVVLSLMLSVFIVDEFEEVIKWSLIILFCICTIKNLTPISSINYYLHFVDEIAPKKSYEKSFSSNTDNNDIDIEEGPSYQFCMLHEGTEEDSIIANAISNSIGSSLIRDYGISLAIRNFDESYQTFGSIVRALSIYKEMRNNWHFVNDPLAMEYIDDPESMIEQNVFAGDCEDFSIMLGSLLVNTGFQIQVVMSVGHVYIELYVGEQSNLSHVTDAISKLFKKPANKLNFRYDQFKKAYYLNLDWFDPYPGGKYYEMPIVNRINFSI